MLGTISKEDIVRLRQPCKNRGVVLTDNENGTVAIDQIEFDRCRDAEAHLEQLPRIDI
jgi:hypothetical protein